ncbi:MAG: Gfo/Idh/MocA family oxidoreductase [Deltaproteobacteria bacterium]|nr:Gfo/Idh/MocA family oxidoreductase [Deltaproteobacteria bacterium]
MKILRAGIIGGGNAGNWHANSIKKVPHMCEVAAIADLDEKRLKRLYKKHKQATMYLDYKEILGRDDIDTVHICLPHHLHRKITVEALKAGKHVLCEKPISNTLEEADAMIKAASESRVKFMIAENQRFLPAHIKIKEIIDAGTIGEVKLIRTYEGGSEVASMSDPDSWKSNIVEAGGGAWMDSGIHRVAVLQYLFGDIESISGKAQRLYSRIDTKADDNCAFSLQFANGALCSLACSFTVASEWNNSLEVYGTKGTILENHNWGQPIKLFSTLPGHNQGKWITPEVEHKVYPGYYPLTFEAEIRHFYECIINDTKPLMTGEDGKKALEIILLGYKASRTGKIMYRDKKKSKPKGGGK